MELLDLIQVADSASQVIALLGTYLVSLRATAVLPESFFAVPLDNEHHVEERMVELIGMVSMASRQLDHRRVSVTKQALQVFAIALWKLKGKRRPHGAARPAAARD